MTDLPHAMEAPVYVKDGASAWLMLGLLSLAFVLSMVDRTVLSLMVDPIKTDLQLSDTAVSLLQGASFAVLYAVAGLPIAWLADRSNRKNLIAAGIAAWSAMTAICGFSNSYSALFAARAGVAIGEAALSPASYSMFADSFSQQKLGRAIGIFTASGVVGTGLALLVGGKVLAAFTRMGGLDLGPLGILRPWQSTFVIFAVPGFLLAVILFCAVREPPRRIERQKTRNTNILTLLRTEPVGYFGLIGGYAALAALGYAFLNWAPTSLIRVYNASASQAGMRMGMIMLAFGTVGPIGAGLLSDRLSNRQGSKGPLRFLVLASFFAMVFAVGAGQSQYMSVVLVMYCGIAVTFTSCLTIVPLTLQLTTPPECRAQIAGLTLAFGNVIGLSAGPLMVGLLNDYVFSDHSGIATSLPVVMFFSAAIMLMCFCVASRSFKVAS